jgi:hypothetical protein
MKLGPTFLASWVATVAGIYILQFMNAIYHTQNEDKDLFGPIWTLIILSVICEIGAYFGHVHNKFFLVFGFAFIASYLIVRGISLTLGGFVSETSILVGLFSEEDAPDSTVMGNLYLIAIVVLTYFLRERMLKKDEQLEEHPEEKPQDSTDTENHS